MRVIAIAAALLIAGPAVAAGKPCGPAASMSKQLLTKYRELPIGMGLGSDGNLWQLWSSERGTWTVVRTTPKGVSCVIAAGKHGWQQLEPVAPKGKPA